MQVRYQLRHSPARELLEWVPPCGDCPVYPLPPWIHQIGVPPRPQAPAFQATIRQPRSGPRRSSAQWQLPARRAPARPSCWRARPARRRRRGRRRRGWRRRRVCPAPSSAEQVVERRPDPRGHLAPASRRGSPRRQSSPRPGPPAPRGTARRTSSAVMPCHSPTWISRSRASRRDRQAAAARRRSRAVSAARVRSLRRPRRRLVGRERRAPPPAPGPARASDRSRVELALPDAAGVVVGLAVPQHDDAGAGRAAGRSSALGRPGRPVLAALGHAEVDLGAVLPEPLELVELALLVVLDVHDDVAEVDEDPAAVALALAADRLGARARAAGPRPRRRWRRPGARWGPRR